MTTMTDILNPTFLMCLGIILISIACLVIYFENKFRDQNHKMTTMLGLVTALTDEVNNTKKFLSRKTNDVLTNESITHQLVEVSDDDDEDESDDDDDESDDEEDESDDDEKEDEDDDTAPTLCIYDANKTKILKIDITTSTPVYAAENLEELQLISESESDTETESIDSKLDEQPNAGFSQDLLATELKTIDITNLDDLPTVDYKKLSVPKLKILVGEKGLVADCSKMKKNDLLKLLETV
jgi:hypothetical protein